MSLGNLLLQPQRLQRETGGDPRLEVAQDVLRLLTLLAEDASDEGPLAGVMPELLSRLGERLQTRAGDGVNTVYAALKDHFNPLFLYFEGLVDDVAALESNPTALLGIIRQLIDSLRSLLDSINQAQIKAQLDFAKGLLEDQLGIDPLFVNDQVGALFDDLVDLWQGLPADISSKPRRRRRIAIQIIKRLRRHLLDRFTLPEIDTARAADKLYRLLQSSGLPEIFSEIYCTLDRFDEAVSAVDDIRAALPLDISGESVGAAWAMIEPEGSARYCWYASWLLSDIDLPLLGTGDIEDHRLFAINVRFRTSVVKRQAAVSKYLFSTLTLEQQREVMEYTGGSTEPSETLIRLLVGKLNMLMQEGPIYTSARFDTPHSDQSEQNLDTLPFEFRLRADEAFTLPPELEEMSQEYRDDQELLLYNRRFLEWVYGEDLIDSLWDGFWRYTKRKTIGVRRDVYISGDGRFLMCDDIPLYTVPEGTELNWQDAPLFLDKESGRSPVAGATYYRFTRVSAVACEVIAQVFYGLEQTVRPIWHLVELQPGHEIGTGVLSGLDILHALNMLFFGKPISGYESLGGWGSWLANDWYGARSLALFGGSFQGMHTEANAGNGLAFWVTVILGDYIRIFGHNSKVKAGRDGILCFFTLLNSSPSNSGDSSLPDNPAANHLKQDGIIAPMNLLFAYLLMLNYKKENHSIKIWSADDIGDRRKHAFGLWLGGGIGFGILGGLAGSILSQFIAWQEDWKLLGITIAEAIGFQVVFFWFLEYLFKEGDTGGGTYDRLSSYKGYKGYPAKSTSPYKLPYAPGVALYMGQGNNGLFSHNEIGNIGKPCDNYAFDFGHDHRQMIHAMRAGVVVAYFDQHDDNDDENTNYITIRHDTPPVDDHDDPLGTGTPAVTYARYRHGAKDGVINVLGASTIGTHVNQGAPIMEADDTGTSFHSHLHVYVVRDDGGNDGDESIPLVFADVDNDEGVPEFLTWYRAGD